MFYVRKREAKQKHANQQRQDNKQLNLILTIFLLFLFPNLL